MGTHPIFESDFDCLTEIVIMLSRVASTRSRLLSYSCRLCTSKQTNTENKEIAATQNPLKIRDIPIEYTNVQPEDFKTFEEYFPHSPFNLLGSGKDVKLAARISAIRDEPDPAVWLDYGGKFDAFCSIAREEVQQARYGKKLQVGDRVSFVLHETESAAHFLGVDHPVSMRLGYGTFLGILKKTS